ncbi:MAG: SH3 domain-containing protein [Patescibacteria group bacterium]|mgnify:FL=1
MQSSSSFLIVALGYLVFGISAIIWISKKKKAGEKISLLAKIIIATVFLSSSSVLLSFIEVSPTPETSVSEAKTLYVKTGSANVRECPSTSCKIIDSLPQNEKLIFPGNLYDKYPEWTEITFPNGQIGYVSKTTLSENPVSERQLTPTDDSSSVGGIAIGPWADIQAIVGEYYETLFCEPPSAISGATCGALADTTTDPRGGTPPYSFIKKSGFLPPGMALELNGTLKGSPTQEGTYNFRMCAKDLYGGEGCQNLEVVVKKAEGSPEVNTTPPQETYTSGNYRAV